MHPTKRASAGAAAIGLAALLLLSSGCTSKAAETRRVSSSAPTSTVSAVSSTPAKTPQPTGTLADGTKIVLLAWNDLGMHCFNADFSKIAILPPYNNLYAQVVKVGEDPTPITSGLTIEYRYPDNTWSVGGPGKPQKSNFWMYAKALFGADLKPDIGLTGRGLSGSLDAKSGFFVAQGIPVTDQRDVDAGTKNIYPYQLAEVTLKDSTGKAVAWTSVVTPVSTEMKCDKCHCKNGDACVQAGIKSVDDTYQNILLIHDKRQAATFKKLGYKLLVDSAPVLCASCHSDNALGAAGKPGISSMSNAMHLKHSAVMDIKPTTEGCQKCHPGPATKCLRDVHSQTLGFQCPTCHGDLKKVATNTKPWLNEPRCDNPACHKNTPAAQLTQSDPLFKLSSGHHGNKIMCEGCHDSTHALAQSREVNDGIKFVALQGDRSYLKKCSLCHGVNSPDGQTKAHAPSD